MYGTLIAWAILADVSDIPWKEIIGATGGAAWGIMAYMFLSDKIRTTKQVMEWKALYEQERTAREKAEAGLIESMKILRKSTEVTETVVKKDLAKKAEEDKGT